MELKKNKSNKKLVVKINNDPPVLKVRNHNAQRNYVKML